MRLLASVLFWVAVMPTPPARADVPPIGICSEVGDECETEAGEDGVCTISTCSRLDYSDGTPPTSVDYECNLCQPAEASTDTDSSFSCAANGPVSALGPLAFVALAWGVFFFRRRPGD